MPSTTRERKSSLFQLRDEDKTIVRNGLILTLLALAFASIFALLVHNDVVRLHPSSTTAETLKGFAARVEYTLRYQSLLIFWLLFNVLATIHVRFASRALNPLDDNTEGHTQAIRNILTNSLEQIVISVFAQLIFVSYAEPATILRFIPLVNVLQFIGRVAFLAGYPMFRSFGMINTLVPNLALVGYDLYKLGAFMELY